MTRYASLGSASRSFQPTLMYHDAYGASKWNRPIAIKKRPTSATGTTPHVDLGFVQCRQRCPNFTYIILYLKKITATFDRRPPSLSRDGSGQFTARQIAILANHTHTRSTAFHHSALTRPHVAKTGNEEDHFSSFVAAFHVFFSSDGLHRRVVRSMPATVSSFSRVKSRVAMSISAPLATER